jgi:hypothetical protein
MIDLPNELRFLLRSLKCPARYAKRITGRDDDEYILARVGDQLYLTPRNVSFQRTDFGRDALGRHGERSFVCPRRNSHNGMKANVPSIQTRATIRS